MKLQRLISGKIQINRGRDCVHEYNNKLFEICSNYTSYDSCVQGQQYTEFCCTNCKFKMEYQQENWVQIVILTLDILVERQFQDIDEKLTNLLKDLFLTKVYTTIQAQVGWTGE